MPSIDLGKVVLIAALVSAAVLFGAAAVAGVTSTSSIGQLAYTTLVEDNAVLTPVYAVINSILPLSEPGSTPAAYLGGGIAAVLLAVPAGVAIFWLFKVLSS